MSADQLIRARFVIPLDPARDPARRIQDGFLLTRGASIDTVGSWSEAVAARLVPRVRAGDLEVIGSSDDGDLVPCLPGMLLPAFVKAHGHDHESPIIGIAKDEPLTDWLDHAVNQFTGFVSERREELEQALGCSPHLLVYQKARLDDLSFGITSSMVHHCNYNKYHLEEIRQANLEAGTRMILAVGGQDRNYDRRLLDTPDIAVKRLDDALERFGDSPEFLVVPGPDQFFSNGPEMLKALKRWARAHNRLVHIHSSEEPRTTRWFRETYGMTPVEYGHSIDFLDEDTVVAHQVHCTEHDLEILRDTGTRVVHNPLANTILGSGMPPVLKMREMGIPVAISTDGSGSADNQNIVAAARLASQYQKARNQDARVMTAREVLEMVTFVPSEMLGFNVGSLAAGRDADFILFDTRVPNLTPTRLDNCVENLIWAANGNEARFVASRGRLLVDDYRFTSLDARRILDQIQTLSEMFVGYRAGAGEIRQTGARADG